MKKSNTKKNGARPIFSDIMKASDYWDSHSVADCWDETCKVNFEIKISKEPKYIVLEPKLSKKIWRASLKQGLTPDAFIDSLLKEKARNGNPTVSSRTKRRA